MYRLEEKGAPAKPFRMALVGLKQNLSPNKAETGFVSGKPQGVTKGFKGNQDKDSSQMNPKEIEWLRQPPKISICYHHSIRPVYKPA